MNFIENCRTAIGYDTSPGQSNRSFIEWIQSQAESLNLFVNTQHVIDDGVEQFNVLIRPQSTRAESEFLLQTHLDTVNPGPFQMWSQTEYNPFDATIVEGKIFGLGAADAKLDFLCKLEALSQFQKRSSWKLPPVLVGTFGEQSGMTGAMKLIRKNLVRPRFALIGEPTHLQLVYAAKGFASVEIKVPFSDSELSYRQEHNLRESTSTQSKMFMGKPAHSSNPEMGESAIVKMLEYLSQLPDGVSIMEIDGGTNFNSVPSHALLELDINPVRDPISMKLKNIYKLILRMESDFKRHSDFDFHPAHPTLNIGVMRTHEDHVQILGNCRIPPIISQNTYLGWMNELKTECQKLGAEFRVQDYKRPFRTSTESVFLKGGLDTLRSMGLSDQPVTQPSTNESSLFSRLGAECLCFGPGKREGNVHTPDENVKIEDLNTAVEFYSRMIERFSA